MNLFFVEHETGFFVGMVATGRRTAEIMASCHYGGFPSEWVAFAGHYNEDGTVRKQDWKRDENSWREP